MTANVYEAFAREYRELYNSAAESSRLSYRSEEEVERRVAACVAKLDSALRGEDARIAYLAVSHVLEFHLMGLSDGR